MTVARPRSGYLITDPLSLTTFAVEKIRSRIIDGTLSPGARVIEETIGAELGVSRPPVREALRVLEGEGLVRLVPRRGAVVVSFTLQDVFEILTFREALEHAAVESVLQSPAPVSYVALNDAVTTLENNARAGREDLAVADSARFHEALVGLAANSRLSAAYLALSNQLQILMHLNRLARRDNETLEQRAQRHRDLVRAIEGGDRVALRALLHGGASLSFLTHPAIDLTIGDERAQAWLAHMREPL